jgi:hypothetical protein
MMRRRIGLANLGQQSLVICLRGSVEVFLGQRSFALQPVVGKMRQSWGNVTKESEVVRWQPIG